MKKNFWEKLKEKNKETTEIPLQDFGRFSLFYREIASYFKTFPLKALLIFSFLGALFLIYLLGASFVGLASIIAGGF